MFRQNSFTSNKVDPRNSQSFYDENSLPNNTSRSKHNLSLQTISSKNRSFHAGGDVSASMNSEMKMSFEEDENSSNIYLKSSGKFINKQANTEAGLVTTFWNYPVRNTQWPIIYTCFNQRSGGFCIADERGQVYRMSIINNIYQSVRLASTAVSAMCFLHTQKNLLAIAYENGVIVIVNSDSKEIVGNIQVRNKATARIIRSHPSLARIIIATDDRTVSMWDYSSCHCIQSLECEEAIVDVRFELSGDAIAITLEQSGAYLYAADTCQLLVHLTLPDGERKPSWSAYCSCVQNVSNTHTLPINNKKEGPARLLNVLLAADNSMVYSWCVDVTENYSTSADVLVNLGTSVSAARMTRVPVKAHLVGVVELPLKMRSAVSIVSLGGDQYPPRVAIMSADGSAILVDIDGFRERSVGFWKVVSDLSAQMLQGSPGGSVTIAPSAVGKHHRPSHQPPVQQTTGSGTSGVAYGKLDVANDYLVVVGQDGAARLIDTQLAVSCGELCGTALRTRAPYSTGSAPNGGVTQHNVHYQPQQHNEHHSHLQSAPPLTCDPFSQSGQTSRYQSNDDFYLQDSRSASDAGSESAPAVATESRATIAARKLREQRAGKKGASSVSPSTITSTAKMSPKPPAVATGGGNHMPRSGKERAAEADKRARAKTQSFVSSQNRGSNNALRGLSAKDTLSTPLFELATLTTKEKQVNLQKLKTFLTANGEYPSRYRPLIWRFLLKLPENTHAYSDLVQRGVHPSFENLFDRYPIENKKTFARLQGLCSQLAHWAPILGEAPYLPSLVFPFVLLFGSDELAALETSLTIFMWWGFSWHATHPNPPMHVLDSLDSLLKLHDNKVYLHLKKLEIAPGVLCWTMLSTLFSELLSRNNWFKLMDFLFTHFDNLAFFLLTPIAVMRELKVSLLGADSDTQVNAYCRAQQGIEVNKLIKQLQELVAATPIKFLTGISSKHIDRSRFQQGSDRHVVEAGELSPEEEARENLALSGGVPIFPLSATRYPIYDGFPRHVLDLQIKERNKVLALGLEVSRKEGVLSQLQKKLEEIETDHAQWMNRHLSASETELSQQKEVMEREKIHLRELHRIEEDISTQRIRQLQSLEAAAKEEMALMDRAAEDSRRLLVEGEAHMREKMQITLSLQKHRELAEQAELATQEKIRTLRMRRARDDWVKGMSGTLKIKEEELAARDAIVNEKWKKQDDEVRLQRELRASQAKAFEDGDAMARMQEELSSRMSRLQMDREAKIIEIERARAIRLAKEQAEEAIEAQERASLLLRKQAVHVDTEQSSLIGMHSAQQAEAKMMETVTLIREESSRLIDAERVHALKNSKARQDARQAQLRKEWAEKSTQQLQAVLATEGDLQDHMLRLQRASMQSEADAVYAAGRSMDALVGEQIGGQSGSSGGYDDMRREMESLGDRVLTQQRERYSEMRQNMTTNNNTSSNQQQQQQQQNITHSNSMNTNQSRDRVSSEFRRLQDGYYIDTASGMRASDPSPQEEPRWVRPVADIPAPSSGAGIGYGVQSAAANNRTSASSSSSSHALSAASIAAEARNAMSSRSSSLHQHHHSSSLRTANDGVTVQDVHSSGGSNRGSVSSHSSSSTVDVQQRAHHPKTAAAANKTATQASTSEAREIADDGVSIGSDSIANIAGDMRNYESSDSELSNHPLDDVRAHVASTQRASSSSHRSNSSGDTSHQSSSHWDHPAMNYDDDLGATIKRGAGGASRSVWRDEEDDEEGDVLPPSLSLTATLGPNSVKGGARYGTSSSSSSHTMISGATQTLGNASATLRSSSSSQNRNSGELKKLAEESLRNLQETRSLNRTEAAEETQQEQVRQMVRDKQQTGRATTSSTTTTTTRTTTQQSQSSCRQQQQQNVRTGASTTSRSRGVPPRSALDDLDVTVDSDSALWAFEAGSDFH